MKNLTWFQARALARQGKAIRREAWRKWLTRTVALWWLDRKLDGTEQRHVVINSEFKAAEFMAKDWTDEPWDATPAPTPTDPLPPAAPGGGSWGTIPNPPDPISIYQPPGPGGGGGGSTPPGDPSDRSCPDGYHLSTDGRSCVKDAGGDKTPNINVDIPAPDDSKFSNFDGGQHCFRHAGDDGSPRTLDEIFVSVSITGGPPGVGTLHVELQGHTQLGTGWPGMNQDFSFSSISYTPGSSITATVNYTINGTTYTGTGTYTFPNWCASGGAPVGEGGV